MAPFAVAPDALGEAWHDGRVCLDLSIDWNGERFGKANGREMSYGFHELVAHAAATRDLVAGTIIATAAPGIRAEELQHAIDQIAHDEGFDGYQSMHFGGPSTG